MQSKESEGIYFNEYDYQDQKKSSSQGVSCCQSVESNVIEVMGSKQIASEMS